MKKTLLNLFLTIFSIIETYFVSIFKFRELKIAIKRGMIYFIFGLVISITIILSLWFSLELVLFFWLKSLELTNIESALIILAINFIIFIISLTIVLYRLRRIKTKPKINGLAAIFDLIKNVRRIK